MKNTRLNTLFSLGKLAGAGAVIAGIGFAFMTQDPTSTEVGPSKAEADIADFAAVSLTQSQEFTKAVVGMGMKPRAFDYNGNTLFFASGSYDMKPMEFMEKSQDHFVKAGINKKDHGDTVPLREQARRINWDGTNGSLQREMAAWGQLVPTAEAMVEGDVVPTDVTPDRIEMVGYKLNTDGKALLDAIDAEDKSGKSVRNLMGGYRYMDAHWEPGTGRSAVTAVWTGEDFAAERMEGQGAQSPPDPNVPACVGCIRNHRVQSLDKNEPYQSNMYTTTALNVSETYDFYRTAMTNRGWAEGGVQPTMNRLGEVMPEVAALNDRGRILTLERGNEALQVAIFPGETGAQVVTLHETAGAQNELPDLLKK